MAMMLAKLYAALRLAGVPDGNAIAASEEVAGFETRLASVESGLNLLKRMVGFNLVMTAALVTKAFVESLAQTGGNEGERRSWRSIRREAFLISRFQLSNAFCVNGKLNLAAASTRAALSKLGA